MVLGNASLVWNVHTIRSHFVEALFGIAPHLYSLRREERRHSEGEERQTEEREN